MKLVVIFFTIFNVLLANKSEIKNNKIDKKGTEIKNNKIVKKSTEIKKEIFIKKLKENYEKREQIKCNFYQTFYHKAYKRTKKSSGKLYLENDLKMKWEYNKPEKKFIISNNKILWVYEPDNEQAFKTKIKGSDIEIISKFLTGKLDLFTDYKLELIKKNTLLLVPKTKKTFKSIKLITDGDFNIIKTIAIDNFDNVNTIEYKNLISKFDKLQDSFFEFIPSDEIEIISN